MNPSLNSRFQADYIKYTELISNVKDTGLQTELLELLNSLATRVHNIEKMHTDLISGNNALHAVSDERQKIISIRKQLDTKLKHLTQ
jgi:hypothetical protein